MSVTNYKINLSSSGIKSKCIISTADELDQVSVVSWVMGWENVLYQNKDSLQIYILVRQCSVLRSATLQGGGNYSVDAQVVDGEWVGFYLMVCIAMLKF